MNSVTIEEVVRKAGGKTFLKDWAKRKYTAGTIARRLNVVNKRMAEWRTFQKRHTVSPLPYAEIEKYVAQFLKSVGR